MSAAPGDAAGVQDGGPAAQEASSILGEFKEPCTFKGAGAALGAGALGSLFGFLPSAIRYRARHWNLIRADTWASASNFALMGGVYATVQCLAQRVREKEDSWNRAIAGCASGCALGWKSGPLSAAQSCVLLGVFSYVFDFAPPAEPAKAAHFPRHPMPSLNVRATSSSERSHPLQQLVELQQVDSLAASMLLADLPRATWLAPCGAVGSGCPVRLAALPWQQDW